MLGVQKHPNTVVSQSSIQQTIPKNTRDPNVLHTGKVIDIHGDNSTVDVRLYSGDTLRNVRVLFSSANTAAGFRYLASIKNVAPQQTAQGIQDNPTLGHEQDTIAIVAFLNGDWRTPRVIGFDFPVDSQMHLNEPGLLVNRHESGIYNLITADGNYETNYPDGSYLIYGPATTPKDMTAIQGNGQTWNVPSADNKINLTLHLAQGFDLSIVNGKLSLSVGEMDLTECGIKILAKGQGVTFTSPDGTITKTLTIADTTGDPVWS